MLGTLVLFLSETFPHEVLKSQRQRLSLTGWFRVNANNNDNGQNRE
ncbi:MAG: 2OG-Fe(II) oxygenase [Pseudomonadales bacterium]|nr:2OG-Fe(II) oxygenase [Pseudomonadales bacterium]